MAFVDYTPAQHALHVEKMRELVMFLFQHDDVGILGDGDLEMITEALLSEALRSLIEAGAITALDAGHTFKLSEGE